ncbi:hypothetical protein F4818DRAFT_445943 [Hypoxylon cercidicola]|nr:hypothetical protein F4818DRAFT_445943 [Hypoxylon cercidicola]
MIRSWLCLLTAVGCGIAADLSTLPDLLKTISGDVFPGLKSMSQEIHAHPETSTQEFHAHDLVVDYYTTTNPGLWDATPHAYGLITLSRKGDRRRLVLLTGNATVTELDITVSVRTRYTIDLDAVLKTVTSTISSKASTITTDRPYPALENYSTIAPATTYAGFVQDAQVDAETKALLSVGKVVFHPNFGICEDTPGAPCGFNHEPVFAQTAATEHSYGWTEVVARALAQVAVEILQDGGFMREVTKLVRG